MTSGGNESSIAAANTARHVKHAAALLLGLLPLACSSAKTNQQHSPQQSGAAESAAAAFDASAGGGGRSSTTTSPSASAPEDPLLLDQEEPAQRKPTTPAKPVLVDSLDASVIVTYDASSIEEDAASCASEQAQSSAAKAALQLVVDTSGSMAGQRLSTTQTALAGAIDAMPPGVLVGLMHYPATVVVETPVAPVPTVTPAPTVTSSPAPAPTTTSAAPSGPVTPPSTSTTAAPTPLGTVPSSSSTVVSTAAPAGVGGCQEGTLLVPLGALGEPTSPQRTELGGALLSLTASGGTPTYEAYSSAFDALISFTNPDQAPLSRFIVLITDGAPGFPAAGCALPAGQGVGPALVEAAGFALTQRIATFVLGSPGSEGARTTLSQMAEAGGTALPGCSHDGPNYCHFDMTAQGDFAAALAEALTQVTRRALSCDYAIPEPPSGREVDRERVNVQFSSGDGNVEDLLFSSDPDCVDGWTYAGDRVQLCSATCSRAQADPNSELSLLFGCKTMKQPPAPPVSEPPAVEEPPEAGGPPRPPGPAR